jgi:hypothetical protein
MKNSNVYHQFCRMRGGSGSGGSGQKWVDEVTENMEGDWRVCEPGTTLNTEVVVVMERETLGGGINKQPNRFGDMLERTLTLGVRWGRNLSSELGTRFVDPVLWRMRRIWVMGGLNVEVSCGPG